MTPAPDEVRRQLALIVASSGFANADRMSAFLTYVIERTLAGEEGQVKEYAIGVDVFGREASYDPRLDSIVRVEARRLRSKLDEYYAADGAGDPIRISIRRGGYVPAFERRPAATPANGNGTGMPPALPNGEMSPPAVPPNPRTSKRKRLITLLILTALALIALVVISAALRRSDTAGQSPAGIAVLPFTQYSVEEADQLMADRLTDGVTRELARHGTLGVVSATSARAFAAEGRRAAEAGVGLNAAVVVEGSIERAADRLLVSVRLVRTATDRKFWVQDFAGSPSDPSDLERRIAAAVADAALKHAGQPR
jgi:adenylate cyclase